MRRNRRSANSDEPAVATQEVAQDDAPAHAVPGLLIDDLMAQLDRFKLLPGGSAADAERVLAGLAPRSPREREATRELAVRTMTSRACLRTHAAAGGRGGRSSR